LCNAALENDWNKVLLNGLTVGKGDVSLDDFYAVINKRIERVLIRTVRAASKHLVCTGSSQYILCNAALENDWNKVLLNGLTVGKGDVSPDDFYAVINKRIERVLIHTVRAASKHLVCTGSSRAMPCFLTLTPPLIYFSNRKVVLTSNAYLLSI
jgi:hypothetical protein